MHHWVVLCFLLSNVTSIVFGVILLLLQIKNFAICWAYSNWKTPPKFTTTIYLLRPSNNMIFFNQTYSSYESNTIFIRKYKNNNDLRYFILTNNLKYTYTINCRNKSKMVKKKSREYQKTFLFIDGENILLFIEKKIWKKISHISVLCAYRIIIGSKRDNKQRKKNRRHEFKRSWCF